ncbi:MAG: carboxypeptidase-like regulatory domain-containing protein [Candidatus Cloacimonetes bacterium]|nr:carboxypeptidase-like regulatory domain-containing protein [Candidatus Cloacimonadota bacterium]
MAQEITVRGVVHDNKGKVLPGVSVVVKGSTHGTVTDLNGNFEIKVPQGAILEFSYYVEELL